LGFSPVVAPWLRHHRIAGGKDGGGTGDSRPRKSEALHAGGVELTEGSELIDERNVVCTLLHKNPDMHNVKYKLVKSTLPSHYVKHDDPKVPPKNRRAGKQAANRHPVWLDLSLKRVLSVEFVELSTSISRKLFKLHTSL
jgi:hypothetical protein